MKRTAIILLAGWALSCAGATLKILTLDEMTEASSAVVQGRITAKRYDWRDSARNSILTHYTVQADHYLKGNLGPTFEISEPGGKMGMLVQGVPGAPSFQVGEELVLFVHTDPVHARHQSNGFEQGAFRIWRDPVTGVRTVNHSQPLSGGGQIVSSEALAGVAVSGPSTLTRGPHTSRDLGEFLNQVVASVRHVAAQTQVRSSAQTGVRP